MKSLVITTDIAAIFLPIVTFAADTIEVIPVPHVTISELASKTQQGKFSISGKIRRSSLNMPVDAGHVDYVVLDHNNVVSSGTVSYTPSLGMQMRKAATGRQHNVEPSRQKWQSGATFDIVLPDSTPAHAIIRIKYHVDGDEEHLGKALTTGNIAS